jgi:translation elongation factor EF-1alpha
MVVLGHVDAGKSTVTGRLLHLTGAIPNTYMQKLEAESTLSGKSTFKYAWIVNKTKL